MINKLINLASPKLGSTTIEANDEFFAPLERLLSDKDPIFVDGKYDNHGKWMDGWETRRRRKPGFDWALIKLGSSGIISEVNFDTSYFTGNYPPQASLYGCYSENKPSIDSNEWFSIIPKINLGPDKHNNFKSITNNIVNWIKLEIHPDGGIARLRLYGEVFTNWENYNSNDILEVSSLKLGGKILYYNNAHYGDVNSLLTDGRGKNMGDGWETRRRRSPGNDWITIALCKDAQINSLEIDTAFFKGNYPDMCSVQACYIDKNTKFSDEKIYDNWTLILDKEKLFADKIHQFKKELINTDKIFNHIRLNIFPDGGVSRFRVFGNIK